MRIGTRGGVIHNPAVTFVHLAILGILLAGCQAIRIEEPATPAARYMLETIGGFGGGDYPAGSTVHVWANPYSQGWTFDQWQGDTRALSDVRDMHATLTMPARDVRIEATYKRIPSWSASYERMFGRDVYYYFPTSDYRGVIVFFHGSGGDAHEWSDLGAERRHFFDDAVAGGYAIFAIDSGDRVSKQWDLDPDPAANPDLAAVAAILGDFLERGQMAGGKPVYAVGMSRGGQFASLAAYPLGMKATALWVSEGDKTALQKTAVPTVWCLAEHDPIISRKAAFRYYQQLTERGVDARFYVQSPTPLYPLYFVNIEGIDGTASERLFYDFKSKGYLDDSNFLIENPRLSGWDKEIGLKYSEAARLDIQDRLFVAYAEHAFYSACDHRVLDFFAMQSKINAAGSLASYWARTR